MYKPKNGLVKRAKNKSGYVGACLECYNKERKEWGPGKRAAHHKTHKSKSPIKNTDIYRCYVGQTVLHKNKKIYVTQILEERISGRKAHGITAKSSRSLIAGCPIDEQTGNVLHRTTIYCGDDWRHE
jgi:hypothetical protein